MDLNPTAPLPPEKARMVSAGAKILAKQGFDPETAAEFSEHFVRGLRGEPASMEVFRTDLVNSAGQNGLVNPNTAKVKNTSVDGLVGSGVPRERAEQVARENTLFNEARARQVTLSNREILKRIPRIYPASAPTPAVPPATPVAETPKPVTPRPRRTAITPAAQAADPKRTAALLEVPSLPEPLEGQPYDTRLATRPEATMPARPVGELGIERGRVSPVDPDLAAAVEDIRSGRFAERVDRELEREAAPAAVKKPWQMTRSETLAVARANRSTSSGDEPVLVIDKATGSPVTEIKRSQVAKLNTKKYEARELGGGPLRKVDPTIDDGWIGNVLQRHKQNVEAALREGKPVPPAVLADYPELTQKGEVAPGMARRQEALDAGLSRRDADALGAFTEIAQMMRDNLNRTPEQVKADWSKYLNMDLEKFGGSAPQKAPTSSIFASGQFVRFVKNADGSFKVVADEPTWTAPGEKPNPQFKKGKVIRTFKNEDALFNHIIKKAASSPQPPYAPQEQTPVEVLRNQPPGTPAQVAEGKPGEVSQAAGQGEVAKGEAQPDKDLVAKTPPAQRVDIDNGTRVQEFRARKTTSAEMGEQWVNYYTKPWVVERRTVKRNLDTGEVDNGEWSPFARGETKQKAIEDATGDTAFLRADSVDETHKKVVARELFGQSWRADKKKRLDQAANKVRWAEDALLRVKDDANKKYKTALKRAKLYEAAQTNQADPAKIKAVQEKLQAEVFPLRDKAQANLDEAKASLAAIEAETQPPYTPPAEADQQLSLGQPPSARPAQSLSKMQVEQAVRELFFDSATPPNFQVTHNYGKVFNGREVRGWYDPATGTIWLNAAYLRSPQEARAVFVEEAFHAIQNDKAVQKELSRLVASLTPEQLAEARSAYGNISEEQLRMEAVADILEKQQLTQEQRGMLARLWDAVIGAVERLYGKFTGKVFTERDAQDVLAKALKAAAAGRRSLRSGGEVYAEGGLMAKAKAFFSRLSRTVEQSQQNKASGAQWKATIKNSKLGANLDEMALVGVNDLEDGKVYSRQEVLDYLQANEVQVKDVTLGGELSPDLQARADAILLRYRILTDEIAGNRFQRENGEITLEESRAKAKALSAERSLLDDEMNALNRQRSETHFSTYQLPGAKEGSYREVLLTVPDEGRKQEQQEKYKRLVAEGVPLFEALRLTEIDSPNWRDGHSAYSSIANPIVRLRFNERTTQDGKRMLFLEEVQAPQKGQFEKMPPLFQKNWREIAFKWALRHAAENGFDVVGWTTGAQQVERYDLSKQVTHIQWGTYPQFDGKHVLVNLQDGPMSFLVKDGVVTTSKGRAEQVVGKPLDEVVGKELAKQILEKPGGRIEGEGLKVGGEGLKKLYDVDFRNVVNGLPAVKKSGGKVGVAEIYSPEPKSEKNRFGRQSYFDRYETSELYSDGPWMVVGYSGQSEGVILGEFPTKQEAETAKQSFLNRSDKIHALPLTPAIKDSVMGGQAMFSTGPLQNQLDQQYFAAVQRGDMQEVQRLVDEAARGAGYNVGPVFHGTTRKKVKFISPSKGIEIPGAAFLTDNEEMAEEYVFPREYGEQITYDEDGNEIEPGIVVKAFIRLKNPATYDMGGDVGDTAVMSRVVKEARRNGNDGVVFTNVRDGLADSDNEGTSFAVFESNQTKSADPITYDDAGNIIPLSQRFQQESPDIRYSLGERVQGPQEDNLGAKYTDAVRASESAGSRQDFLRGTDAQIEAAITGADVSAVVREGAGRGERDGGGVRGLRSGTESAAGKTVPKVRVFISTDALDSTARKNSEILASRIFPAESGTQAAALSDMDEGDFVLTAARRTPFFVTIFSAEGEKSPLARTQTLADGTPAIIFNTTNLGKFNLQDAATAAQFDGVLSEELIHVAAISVTSQKEAQDVWASLSDKEKKAAERSYNRRRNKDALSDYELGHEYLRMVIQERMFGKTTEQVELRITEPVKKFLRKLLNFIKEAFGKKPENDIARQLVSRIESALNGETPRQYSIIPSGTSLATNISQSDATEVQGRAIEPSVIAAAGRAVADLGRQTVEEYEQAGRELEGLAYESKAFRQARSELNNLVSLHEGRLRQLPQDRVTDDMRANIRDGVSIENGQIVVGDELVTKLAQMGVQFRPELVKALQAEVYFEQQARRLVDNLGKLATLKELLDYYTRIKAPADEIEKLNKLIAAKEKVVANLTPVTVDRNGRQEFIGDRASDIISANASKVELQAKRDALTLEPVQEFFGKGITELRDLSEKAKAAADLTRALMDSSTSISEVARLGEIYDKWASFDQTVKDALKQGTLTDEQRASVLTSLQKSFDEFDVAKSQMDDLLNSEEKGLLKDIRLAEADIADAKVTSGLADVLVADALKAAKGEMGLTGTVGDAANIANLEASTGAITTLAANLGRTLDQNRWLYDFLMAPGDMPAFGASVAQSLGISETALREVLKVVQQSPSLASAIVTLTDDAAAKLANSPPLQMQSIATLATSGNPVGMVLAANLTSQIVQQANAQGTKANAARQTAARQLAQSVLRLRTLQQGQALFNQTANSPAFQQLRGAANAGAAVAQKMVVLGPTGPVLRGFKSAAKDYQPELKIDVDTNALELSKTRDKVWKYLQNAEQYVEDYEAAAALHAANPANPSPQQLGFDVADYNGLKFAIENQIWPMFLNMGDMDDAARAAQYLTPVGVRKLMKAPAFIGQVFLQYEQLGKMVGGTAGNIFRQQIAKYKRGYLDAKRVGSQFQDLPKLQSAAMRSHGIKSEETYRKLFNEMAHYGREYGTRLRVGFPLPRAQQLVTKEDMEFFKRTLAFEEKLRREVTEIDPVTGVRYMRGGKEITRKGAYVGDAGMPRHLNRGATQFIADVINAYADTPKGFTAATDLSSSSTDEVVKYWNEHLDTLKQHILDSTRTDRTFKQSAEMAAAEKRIAARWLAGNMDQVNSVQDLVNLIAAEIPATSGKNPLDTAREGLNNELLQYVAHAQRIQKERAEDNAKTSGLSIALSSDNEFTKPAANLELPSEYYDYGAVSSIDRITALSRANHSVLVDFANSLRLAITELQNRVDRLNKATTDKERAAILENYKSNPQEMQDVLELLKTSLKNFEDSYRAGGPDLVPTKLGQKLLKAVVGSVLAKLEIAARNLSQGQIQVLTNAWAMNYMSASLAAWKALTNVPRGVVNTGYLVARNIAGFADRRLGRDPQFQRTLKGAVDVVADGIFKSAQLALLKPRVGAKNVRASFERVSNLGFDVSDDWWQVAKQAWSESGQFRNQLEMDKATKTRTGRALYFLERIANTGLDAANAFVRGSVLEASDLNMNALSLGLVGNMEKRLQEVAMVFGKRLTDAGITEIDPANPDAMLKPSEWLPSLNQQTAVNSLAEVRKFLESSASSEGFHLEKNLLKYYQDTMAGKPAEIFNQRTFDAVQRSMIAENNAALPTNRASAGQASTLWRTLLTLQGYPADAFLKLLRISTGGSRDRKKVLQAASKITAALGFAAIAILFQGAGDAGSEWIKRKFQGKRADRPTPLDADFYTDPDHLMRAMGNYLLLSSYYIGDFIRGAYGWVDGRSTIDPLQKAFALATTSQIARDITSGAKIAMKGGTVEEVLAPLRRSITRLTFGAPELEYMLGKERDTTEAARRGITENAKAKGFELPAPGFGGTVGLTNIKRKALSQAVSDMDIAQRKGDAEGYAKAKAAAQKQLTELEDYYLKQRLEAGDSPEVAAKTAKASVWGDYQENNPVTAALGGKRPTAEQYKQLVESSTGERGQVIRQGIKAWQDGAQALFGKPGNITKEDVAENRSGGTVKEPSYGRVSLTGGVSGRMKSVGVSASRGRRAKIRRVSLTGRRRKISPMRSRRKKIRRVRLTA